MNGFAGTDTNIDTDPEHLARLKAVRTKAAGVYEIRTYPSRILFGLSKPKEQDIRIEDIAHSLAMQCRFCGHVPVHYSVAQHSLLVGYLANNLGLPPEHYGAALMHDAHEAYSGDITSPMKRLVGRTYTNPADDIQAAIHKAFCLPALNASVIHQIKKADHWALEIEQEAIARGNMVVEVPLSAEDQCVKQLWAPLSQADAKEQFLAAWSEWKESNVPCGTASAAGVAQCGTGLITR